MNTKPLLHKWWVWLILIVCLLFITVTILTSRYFNPWLEDKLETTLHERTNGLYTLRLYGLDASLLGGRISTDSLHLIPDFEVWESTAAASEADTTGIAEKPLMLVNLQTKALVISGVNFIGILRGKPLDVSVLKLKKPVLAITEMRQETTTEQEPLHESVQGIMKNARINKITIEEGTLRVKQGKEAKADKIKLEGLSMDVRDLRLDSASFHDDNRAYYARRMALESGKVNLLLPDGTYRLHASALKADTEDGTLNIGSLELVPLLKNAELARREGMAVSTLKVEIPEINVSGVDYRLHSRYNNLVAGNVVLKNPSLSAFMDRKNFPQKGNKPLPHDMVQELKTGLTINKIEVQGMHIWYEELAPDAVETGVLTFDNMHATISNLTNDKNRISAENPAVVKAKANLNGDAPLELTIRLDLLDPNGYHTIQGRIGKADPATLNPILEPTAFISVKEGQLHPSEFNMELYRNRATGNLNVRYSDFKVDVLTKDEDKRQSLGKRILSKVANKVVIKSDNPKNGEELRPGDILVVRARSRSVFNYWKDCLVSGFRSAAGINGLGVDLEDPNRS